MHCRHRMREVSRVSRVSRSRQPGASSRSQPLSVGLPLNSDSYASLDVGIAPSRWRSPSRPQACSRTERAPCLRRASGLGSTMHRAGAQRSRATRPVYNSSSEQSRTTVNFVFASFFAPYGEPGVAGRTGDHATARVAQPACQQCLQPRHDSRRPSRPFARTVRASVTSY